MHWKTNISQFIRVCKTPSSRFTTLWPLQVVITLTSVSLFTRLSLLVVVFFFILACFVLFLSTASISQLPNVLLQVEKPEMQWNSQFSLWHIYQQTTVKVRNVLKRYQKYGTFIHDSSAFWPFSCKSLPKCLAVDRHFYVNLLCISRISLEML